MSDEELATQQEQQVEEPKNRTRDPYAPFKEQIVEKVIGPVITELVEKLDREKRTPDSIGKLHEVFREVTGSVVSASLFGEWCDSIGLKITAKVTVSLRRPAMPPPIPSLR